ncbi:MAG TPA: hypothetical protein VIJ96_07405 [Acidothermaceae bacterium]
MSARARRCSVCVVAHLLVDDVGQASFQAAHRFHGGFAGGDFPVVVAASFRVGAQLHDGRDVQHPVDAPVPGAGEPVPVLVTGGCI